VSRTMHQWDTRVVEKEQNGNIGSPRMSRLSFHVQAVFISPSACGEGRGIGMGQGPCIKRTRMRPPYKERKQITKRVLKEKKGGGGVALREIQLPRRPGCTTHFVGPRNEAKATHFSSLSDYIKSHFGSASSGFIVCSWRTQSDFFPSPRVHATSRGSKQKESQDAPSSLLFGTACIQQKETNKVMHAHPHIVGWYHHPPLPIQLLPRCITTGGLFFKSPSPLKNRGGRSRIK
jgi:hypothetical protein